MSFSISKQFTFSASHALRGLPDGHPCTRLHGHNYIVEITLTALALDPVGMVVDYGELAPVGAWIDTHFDHRHLNDAMGGVNPTAENLACAIHAAVGTVVVLPDAVELAVAVSETPKTWARYRA